MNKGWDDIEIPEELDLVIQQAVELGSQSKKHKKKFICEKKVFQIAAGMAICIVFVSFGFLSSMAAEAYSKIPLIGNIFSYLYALEDSEIPYVQISDNAKPIEVKESEIVQDEVSIFMQDVYCDGYSLYLSMEIKSQTPFCEIPVENTEASIQVFSEECIVTETGEEIEIGNGSLILKGVLLDANTFVGVARSGSVLENYDLGEKISYQFSSHHMKVYVGEKVKDIRGEWKNQGSFACNTQALETIDISKEIMDGLFFKEVRLQPYEIQAVIEETSDISLISECLCLEAFDEKGNRLNFASDVLNRFVHEENSTLEIWMFERPQNVNKITIYMLNEQKWLDEWKGYLYCESPWTGEEMMEFLQQNCETYVELPLN